ncbi:MAG: class IV adenylate cyclase [Candidatus Sumerlaeota bacterium]|nr:class IV adenylate cyclase [Candidatus Sumerlaeota bacterium]
MARNIEIKARIESVEALIPKAAALAAEGPVEIAQDDTFFRCEGGRLKLRIFCDDRGELIFYRRPDQQGPKECFYLIAPTCSPNTLRELLSQSNGQVGRVEKRRTLFIAGRTRIHLDCVKHLGDFLEIEVVLKDGEPIEAGIAEAHALLERLGVESSQLIEGAYIDLLAQKRACPFQSKPSDPT